MEIGIMYIEMIKGFWDMKFLKYTEFDAKNITMIHEWFIRHHYTSKIEDTAGVDKNEWWMVTDRSHNKSFPLSQLLVVFLDASD